MKLLSKDKNFEDVYEVIDGLLFKDKLNEFLNPLYALDDKQDLVFEGVEVDNYYALIDEIKEKNLKLLIVADYDADGTCALSITLRYLKSIGINANYYIPSRSKEGYGISEDIANMAIKYHFDVVMTLDNGVSSNDVFLMLKKANIKTICIDHHLHDKRVDVDVFIHPAYLGDYYEGLCTGGLAYILSLKYGYDAYNNILAMSATLADVCKVYKANRQILKSGLKAFNEMSYSPLHALISKRKEYTYSDIAFQIVPKINAVSRLDPILNVNHLIKYLKDDEVDLMMKEKIEEVNNLRKKFSEDMANRAINLVDTNDDIVMIKDKDFLEGLCGLIANRLVGIINKPVIVLSQKDNLLKGSARSVDGVNIYDYLTKFDKFETVGGHAKAMGLSLLDENYYDLKEFLHNIKVNVTNIKHKVIKISEDDLTLDNLKIIEENMPYGEGLDEPLFYLENPKILNVFMIKSKYPKYTLNNATAISFNSKMYSKEIKGIIGRLSLDKFSNSARISINIEEIVI